MLFSSGTSVARDDADSGDMARMLDVVRRVVVDVSDGRGQGRLTPDVSFERELGLGSLERVELAVRASEAFGVRLSEDALGTVDTPRQLLEQVVTYRIANGGAGDETEVSAPTQSRLALLPPEAPAAEPVDATTLVEVLEYHMRHQPDRTHIILLEEDDSTRSITYRTLYQSANAVARALRRHGIEPGRSVAIMLPTGLGYFASFLGALLAGAVPVPLYPPVRLDRIAEYITRCTKILDNSQTQMLITFDRVARVAEIARDRVNTIEQVLSIDQLLSDRAADGPPVRAEVGPDDTLLIQYTSGSTGDPKGVELTQVNVMANIRASREGCALAAGDVLVSWLPLYHDMGLIGGWLMPFYYGVPTVLMSPLAFLSRPERWLMAMSDFRATCSVAPNFAFDLCVKRVSDEAIAQLDLSSVRSILNGSEPVLRSTIDRFVERFEPAGLRREAIFCAYGLAENMVAVAFPPVLRAPRIDRIERALFEGEGRAVVTTEDEGFLEFVGVGHAVPNHEIQVVDEHGQPVPERVQGTIRFRGPSSFKGYFRRPEVTASVQCEGGWVDTGDLGYIAEGELFIAGRVKDLIIKGGRNYYPHEIEAAAASIPGIRQGCTAAFAVLDEAVGTELIVVLAETRERDEMAREVLVAQVIQAVVAQVGVPPDRVVLAIPGAIPKTSSGKIRRRESRTLYLEGTINEARSSAARQAAGLFAQSLPQRAGALVQRVGQAIYGVYAFIVLVFICVSSRFVGMLSPAGRASRKLASYEARLAMGLTGLSPRVLGREHIPQGGFIFVANHCGYLDFLICIAALPGYPRFVIKGELRENVVIGPLLNRQGHVFLERHSTVRSLADLDEISTLLESGEQMILFPEGTFTPDIGLRQFKLGAFRLACNTGVPIVPVAIRGSRKALRDGTWLPRLRPIEVEILAPIHPEGQQMADVVELRDRCAEAIAQRLDEPRLYAADIIAAKHAVAVE